MRTLRSNTKQQILNLAKNYVQSYGFNAFSFQHLADVMQIRKASIHHHFRNKEVMGLALLDDYMSLFEKWTTTVDHESAKKKVALYFKIFERFTLDKFKICPNSVLSSDFKTLSSKMQARLLELHMLQREWLSQALMQGQKSGEFAESFKPADMADVIISSIQGSLELSRIRREPEVFRKVTSSLLRQL